MRRERQDGTASARESVKTEWNVILRRAISREGCCGEIAACVWFGLWMAEVSSGRCPRAGESKRGAIDRCAKSLARSRDPQPYSIMHSRCSQGHATSAWYVIIGPKFCYSELTVPYFC